MLIEPGTFSKSAAAWGLDLALEVEAGRKARIKLNNGHWYLDTTSSLGQNLFAYETDFMEYMAGRCLFGTSFTLPHTFERTAAEALAGLLKDHVPGWKDEKIGVRFGCAGSDVTAAAIRVARAYTGRMPVLTFTNHYHGWAESFIGRVKPAHGCHIDQTIYQHQWGLPLSKYPDNYFAAIIFEHPAEQPARDWVRSLKKYCEHNGTLLIADEVVTGLRYGLGGISEFYGYYPDLYCMGKALANGFRLSALAGKYEIMKLFSGDSPVFWSSTGNGNALEMAACLWVLKYYGPDKLKKLWLLGTQLIDGLSGLGYDIYGHPPRFIINFPDIYRQKYFTRRMFERRILFNRPVMVNLAMTEQDIGEVIMIADLIKQELESLTDKQIRKAAGDLPRQLFRAKR